MTEVSLNTKQSVSIYKSISLQYIFILFISYIIAALAAPILWDKNARIIHTFMELTCIFNALTTFLIIWNTYYKTLNINHVLGFGFLSVAIFDSFHTYFTYEALELTIRYTDLTIRYWIMGRILEVMVLFVFSLNQREFRINKWMGLFFVLAFSFGLSLIVLFFSDILPVMVMEKGPGSLIIILEYAVIAVALLTLYNLKDKLKEDGAISYKHVFMALLFIITAELCFTMNKSNFSFCIMYGHILKILCYHYMYKAIYVSCVVYPYKKLEEAYDELGKTNGKLKEVDDTLNDTLDALPIGIMNYEKDGKIKYMNKRLEKILACNRNSLYGLTAKEFLGVFPTVEQEAGVFQLTHESINNSVNVIRTFKNMKGKDVKLSLTSQKTKTGLLVFFHEAKREQEIKNFHLQTQTILNAVSNSILMIDKGKKIILHNEALKKMLEIEDTEIIGMDIDKLIEMVCFKEKQLTDLLLKGETVSHPLEVSITTFKGNRRELLMYFAPIKNVDNDVIGAISACTDITEMKKHNYSIQQQEKLAMIGQMAAGIVHEIKNPLATIKGLSQLIQSKSELAKVKEYAAVINTTIDDTSRVVSEFLNFAKPKPTVKIRTNVNKIVETMQLITETHCYTKNIKTQFYYSSCPMEITADEIKIKQVILNMTENAIAAMEGIESPELIISTYYDADTREGVIQIADRGAGMSQEVLDKLGTPFFTTREKGTGLGLSICYQIMSEHDGRIEVQSVEGGGTTFKIIFSHIEDLI